MSTPAKIKLFFTICIIVIVSIMGLFAYNLWFGYPQSFAPKKYVLVADKDTTLSTFAQKLEKDGIIQSKDVFLLKAKINKTNPLQLGDYTLSVPASNDTILDQIDTISQQKIDEIKRLADKPTAKVTLKEGLTLDEMFDILEQKQVVSKADMVSFVSDPSNKSKFAFDFLPDTLTCNYGDLKTCAKYYFEGYLYPDTYTFFQKSTPEDIIAKMLTNFDARVWQKLVKKPDSATFYKTMTLASVLEKESGRTKGVTEANKNELQNERKEIAGTLINRTKQGIKWQSDVTATYGHGYDICQQTFEVKNCKYLDDPLTNTKYNTYIIKGYPIGPISNPDFDNINAALNPAQNDYIYFVADVTGKVYFATDDAGHQANITKVKQINRDLGL
jgi:UPF0755 protein